MSCDPFPLVTLSRNLNHRIIEWPGLKRTTMIIEFQPPCHVQGRQPPDQAAQSHIQPGLECLQGWGIHNLLGQNVLHICFGDQLTKRADDLSVILILTSFCNLIDCFMWMSWNYFLKWKLKVKLAFFYFDTHGNVTELKAKNIASNFTSLERTA